MIMSAGSSRHCERSEAIQAGARPLWIATSPAAPRNDGIGNLRDFVASCESNFCAQRHEGTKSFLERALLFIFKALRSNDMLHPNPFPEGAGYKNSISLEGALG